VLVSAGLTQVADKDGTKRVKLSPGASNHERRIATPGRPSRNGSTSPSAKTRIGDPRGHHRLSSVVSTTDSHASAAPALRSTALDDAVHSPFDRRPSEQSPVVGPSPRDHGAAHRRASLWHDDQPLEQNGQPRHLPSLSDVFDNGPPLSSRHSSSDLTSYPFPRSYSRDSAGPPPDLVEGNRKAPPKLNKEQSSAGSISSASSYSFPRTPVEGSLPIHALLSEQMPQPISSIMQFQGKAMATDHKSPFLQRQHPDGGLVQAYGNGKAFPVAAGHTTQQPPLPTPQQQSYPTQARPPQRRIKPEPDLDGMTALLRAGEIVDRRPS
jgi:hypothetical protein